MSGQGAHRYPYAALEHAIAVLAARQRGHVARWQLLELGLGREAIIYRLRTGRVHSVYPGVYAAGHRRIAPIDRAAAAVLACGPRAVLSHFSAAALWGWVKDWAEQLEVTVQGDRRPKAIRVHKTQRLTRRDTTRQHGIPVTTPARTVLDCAAVLPDAKLPRFVNEAFVSNYLKEAALAEVLARHPRHPGAKRLRPYADEGHGRTRSELEDMFVALVERFDLPMPELNFPMNGRVLDAFYREEGVIIEIDSYRFHKTRAAFESDREKDAEAAADGLVSLRLTDDRMEQTPEREARRLEAILAARRHSR